MTHDSEAMMCDHVEDGDFCEVCWLESEKQGDAIEAMAIDWSENQQDDDGAFFEDVTP